MRLDPVNAVSSFHYYMWNAWGEEECKITFGGAYMRIPAQCRPGSPVILGHLC